MNFSKTAIDGVYIIEPRVFADARGYFFESYNRAAFEEAGLHYDFVQDNQSKSSMVRCGACIFRRANTPRPSLCACSKAWCLTWPWICAAPPLPTGSMWP